MAILNQLGITSTTGKAERIFEGMLNGESFFDIDYDCPKDYIRRLWTAYKTQNGNNQNLNGKIFEYIIYTLLYREKILPFYTQAKVAFVPNIEYDTILYSKSEPVSLSLKTSLRERYKQADLEAIALKYVHRKAKCYLLTMDKQEASRTKSKIDCGDIIGLDKIIDCNTDDIDDLVKELKQIQFCESINVDVVKGRLVK